MIKHNMIKKEKFPEKTQNRHELILVLLCIHEICR